MKDWVSPLVLDAMTLRGLGSYLHGARLEIRPLTILCGTNGSGKSTWFRMLRILQASLERGTLPFSFEGDLGCDEGDWHDYTNPLVRAIAGYAQFLVSAAADRDFGPLGTIGLHLKSAVTFDLPEWPSIGPSIDAEDAPVALLVPGSLPHAFLSEGHCPQGTRFRVRMTDPTDYPAIHEDSSLLDRMVELVINERYSIRFERHNPSPTRRYTAICTRAFWPGCDPEDLADLFVAEFDLDEGGSPVNVRSSSGADTFDLQKWFCRVAIARIRELLGLSLLGLYWLGAIRSIERRGHVEEELFEDPGITRKRYVGGEGEYAQALERRFAFNEMCEPESQAQGSISYRFSQVGGDVLAQLLLARDSMTSSPARRIWDSASEESKQAINRNEHSGGRAARSRTVQLLNQVLRFRDLYNPDLWPVLDAETSALVRKGIPAFNDYEVEKLNRKLIEAAFPGMIRRHPGFVFETYYSVWLNRLLDTRQLCFDSADSAEDDWSGDRPPCGYLLKYTPDEGRSLIFDQPEERRNLNRLMSPLFQGSAPAAPVHMSSGFHQVAPIIIQAGLMRANEVLCVENPEVHLHPKLQLGIAEFLLRQAGIGKYMIVETHSDLVVRRVMRAVMAEELRQEAVRLYFTRVDTESEHYRERGVASSVLERVEIDERGQIQNWPTGFMDDDIRESRRLLDIMYGTPGDVEGEEEAAR